MIAEFGIPVEVAKFDRLSMLDQFLLTAQAGLLVSPHGAQLASGILVSPHSIIVEVYQFPLVCAALPCTRVRVAQRPHCQTKLKLRVVCRIFQF